MTFFTEGHSEYYTKKAYRNVIVASRQIDELIKFYGLERDYQTERILKLLPRRGVKRIKEIFKHTEVATHSMIKRRVLNMI